MTGRLRGELQKYIGIRAQCEAAPRRGVASPTTTTLFRKESSRLAADIGGTLGYNCATVEKAFMLAEENFDASFVTTHFVQLAQLRSQIC